MAWVDFRNGVKNLTYGARIRRDRTTLDSLGFLINRKDSAASRGDYVASVAYNGNVFLVVWGVSGTMAIQAARVTEAGVVLDTIPIAVQENLATWPMVVSDGRDFFSTFSMRDTLNNCRYIAGVRVSGSGVVLDSVPIRISNGCDDAMIAFNGLTFNGWDYQVVWTDTFSSPGTEEWAFGARVSPAGVVKDTVQPRLFPTSPRSQRYLSAAAAPGGKVLVAWANNFDGQVYGAFLDTTGREVGVEELRELSNTKYIGVSLAQPLPNPMRSRGEVEFSLPASGKARLAVYDALGRKVRVLLDEEVKAGSYRVRWDGRDAQGRLLPSGVYFLRLEAGGKSLTRKVVLLR